MPAVPGRKRRTSTGPSVTTSMSILSDNLKWVGDLARARNVTNGVVFDDAIAFYRSAIEAEERRMVEEQAAAPATPQVEL